MKNYITPRRKKFNDLNENKKDIEILKDISYQLEELNKSNSILKNEFIKNQKNTFNIFLSIVIPIIISVFVYSYLFFSN